MYYQKSETSGRNRDFYKVFYKLLLHCFQSSPHKHSPFHLVNVTGTKVRAHHTALYQHLVVWSYTEVVWPDRLE